MADLRPLTMVEATRTIWSRLIVKTIARAWDDLVLLNAAQHGFRSKVSTMTATLQYINVLEDAKEQGKPIHRSSWDVSKAFDTVSKNAMTLAWLRLGVLMDVTEWLVGLDQEGVTIVRTPKAKLAWKLSNYQGFRAKQENYSNNMQPMTENQTTVTTSHIGVGDATDTCIQRERRRLHFPAALIYANAEQGGLGIPKISDLVQMDKLGMMWRGLEHTERNSQATHRLLERAMRTGGTLTGG
eukprot:gene10374-biopygen5013